MSIQIQVVTDHSERKSYIARLFSGDLGLAKTYWIYFSIVGRLLGALCVGLDSALASLFYVIYILVICGVVLVAAYKYQGSKVWSILAGLIAVANVIFLLYTIFLNLPPI